TCKFLKKHNVNVQEVAKVDQEDFDVLDLIIKGKVDYVVNTMSQEKSSRDDGFMIRRVAAENGISCLTSLDTADAILKVIEAQSFSSIPMGDIHEN
ncbi:hypothetical protein LJC02_04520, partial [Breznakia sp. OttesenSCG-928-G09]|nr:hypothetical protein [Breznakia sp. OttesenSCG-928-G09]